MSPTRRRALLRFVRDVVLPNPSIGFNIAWAADPQLGPLLVAMASGGGRSGQPHLPPLLLLTSDGVPLVFCLWPAPQPTPILCRCLDSRQVVLTGEGAPEDRAALLSPLRELGPIRVSACNHPAAA